jgi:hypothetical protein
MHASHRAHTRDAPSGAQDHGPVDLLSQDGVWAAHIIRFRRSDRRGLHTETGLDHRRGSFSNYPMGAPVFQAEVEVLKV